MRVHTNAANSTLVQGESLDSAETNETSDTNVFRPKHKGFKNEHQFKLTWSMTSSFDEPCIQGVDRWDGELKFRPKGGEERKVGTIMMYKIGKEVDPKDYFTVFDNWCPGRQIQEFANMFGRKNGSFHDEVDNEVGKPCEIFQCSKLYIEHVEVVKEFRGLGLGLYMVDEACRKINNPFGLTVLSPNPRIYLSWVTEEEGILKLRRHFDFLGFQPLGEYLIARWKGSELPDLQAICPHLYPDSATRGRAKTGENLPPEEREAKAAKFISGWKCTSCGFQHQFRGRRCMMCKKKRPGGSRPV